jgi:hypothetical protein
MPVRAHMPGYSWLDIFKDAAVRTGIYSGAGLSIVFTIWLIVANHVSVLVPFAMARNLVALVLLVFLAGVPVIRFFRLPGTLLASGLIGWFIFSIWYRLLCTVFSKLSDTLRTTSQVFMYGVLGYLIITTVCWIGTIIWRARSHHITHSNHHV